MYGRDDLAFVNAVRPYLGLSLVQESVMIDFVNTVPYTNQGAHGAGYLAEGKSTCICENKQPDHSHARLVLYTIRQNYLRLVYLTTVVHARYIEAYGEERGEVLFQEYYRETKAYAGEPKDVWSAPSSQSSDVCN